MNGKVQMKKLDPLIKIGNIIKTKRAHLFPQRVMKGVKSDGRRNCETDLDKTGMNNEKLLKRKSTGYLSALTRDENA